MTLIRYCSFFLFLVVSNSQAADGLQQLEQFSEQMESFTARFEQSAWDANDQHLQSASGKVVLARPGRFLWHYELPEEQFIVADGERLWQYDVELEQATVSPLEDRVGNTPLALLTEKKPLDDAFELEALGASEGIEWVELTPRESGADFESIVIGMANGQLAVMELRDSLGQATQIVFYEFSLNPEVPDSEFVLILPDAVDVIGQ